MYEEDWRNAPPDLQGWACGGDPVERVCCPRAQSPDVVTWTSRTGLQGLVKLCRVGWSGCCQFRVGRSWAGTRANPEEERCGVAANQTRKGSALDQNG